MSKKILGELFEIAIYILLLVNIFVASASNVFGNDIAYSNRRFVIGWILFFLFALRKEILIFFKWFFSFIFSKFR